MSDLIDRQAAIRAVCERECQEPKPCIGECEAIWALEGLPSVEKRGRWIVDEDGNITCSVCGNGSSNDNFCEHCGARMEDGE